MLRPTLRPLNRRVLRQIVVGKGSGSKGPNFHARDRWDVNHFLKKGGQLFYGRTNIEVALE